MKRDRLSEEFTNIKILETGKIDIPNTQGYDEPQLHYLGSKRVKVMVLSATFSNISVKSWWSVLLEETRVPGENHRPVPSH